MANFRHSTAVRRKSLRRQPRIGIESSTGNVFADLGFPDAADRDAKIRLAVIINRLIGVRRLTQVATGQALGISQPNASALRSYKLDDFSVECLMSYLTVLGIDIEIRVRSPVRARGQGRITVESAEIVRENMTKKRSSKFIGDAVRSRVFGQVVADAKARNKGARAEDVRKAIDKALAAARARKPVAARHS
jgi:predicted XRE-type DNA-binding protein